MFLDWDTRDLAFAAASTSSTVTALSISTGQKVWESPVVTDSGFTALQFSEADGKLYASYPCSNLESEVDDLVCVSEIDAKFGDIVTELQGNGGAAAADGEGKYKSLDPAATKLPFAPPLASPSDSLISVFKSPSHYLLSAASGLSSLHLADGSLVSKVDEALSSLTPESAVLFLDPPPHSGSQGSEIPTFEQRLEMQLSDLKLTVNSLLETVFLPAAFAGVDAAGYYSKDRHFGFNKVAVLQTAASLRAVVLGNEERGGEALWSMLLPRAASNVEVKVFKSRGREVLIVLHYVGSGAVRWEYVDPCFPPAEADLLRDKDVAPTVGGDKARVGEGAIVKISLLSIRGLDGGKGSAAFSILTAESFSVVGGGKENLKAFESMRKATPLYAHTVDKEGGTLKTFQVVKGGGGGEGGVYGLLETGSSNFNPKNEKILSITYPEKETIKSPAVIVGDDSLLLKYLNKNVAVIVTVGTTEVTSELTSGEEEMPFLENAMKRAPAGVKAGGGGGAGKKKPLGVTPDGAGVADAGNALPNPAGGAGAGGSAPTLFINLVDTVSGNLLHRTTHLDGAPSTTSSIDQGKFVPVVISEHWVVYSFWNMKNKRVEVGVLSLWEGMIEKYGITATRSAEQATTFSSFTSPPPIVLQKTFTFGKPITGLGVSKTREGVAGKAIIFSLGFNGQVMTVDKRLLDPRRPLTEPTLAEKMEGLMRYDPMLPFNPSSVVTYTREVEGVNTVQCASSKLESQSLMLAYGGADVFFTRLSPSISDDAGRSSSSSSSFSSSTSGGAISQAP